MFTTDDVGNFAVATLGLWLFFAFVGLEDAWKMILCLLVVIGVALVLKK
jgi:hypothetical protein